MLTSAVTQQLALALPPSYGDHDVRDDPAGDPGGMVHISWGACDARSEDRMARQIGLISSLVAILSIGCSGGGLQVKTSSADVKAGGKVRALFDLHDPSIGPFPSDQFTVADASHITGRRVNLPLPDCAARPHGLRRCRHTQSARRIQPSAAPDGCFRWSDRSGLGH